MKSALAYGSSHMKPKILFLDIETTPISGYVWSIWEQNVGLNQIIEEWSVLSYAAKFLDSEMIYYEDTRKKRNIRDDYTLLQGLHKLLNEADIVVAQNGKQFDIKKINARMIMKGMKPYSPVRVVDTKLVAKQVAAFTSNKLEWLADYLTDSPKSQHKEFPGFEMWDECLKRNPKAFAAMKRYNIQDIISLEKVYKRLLPWIVGHPNLGAYSEEACCTNCGSKNVQHRGFAVLQQGKYHRYHCQDCGKWNRGKIQIIPLNKRRAMLAG
jgi:uncharacterized protein YprB with RNaseH-like and TPR domain